MKNQYSRMDNICPKEPKKLRIPDQVDLYMEDGTVYHVRSFFAGDLLMGDVQDYYDLQELDRPTLMRLIQKIEISEKYTVDDHEERDIHIYYNFVGYIKV